MALIPRKTYPELTALSAPVQDADVLAVYRSPGPLKRTTAATLQSYMQTGVALSATLAASGGSALIGFIQSGTGAAAETVQTALRRTVYSDQYATPQQAITAAGSGGTVIFKPGGTTTLTAPLLLTGLNNVRLVGYGHAMRCGATRIDGYIDCSGSTNVVIEGFNFDGRMSAMPVYTQVDWNAGNYTYNTPIVANGATGAWSYITVRDCTMVDLYTNFMLVVQGTGVRVENCVINIPACTQTYLGTPACQQYSGVYLTTVGGIVSITECSFIGAVITNPALGFNAVYASGLTGQLYIADNRTDYCGRDNTGTHRLGVFDCYGDVQNPTIENNVSTNIMAQYCRLSSVAHGKILHNTILYNTNCEFGYNGISVESGVAFPAQYGCQDILIEGNSIDDPSKRHDSTIALLAYDWGTPLTSVRIINNYIKECARGVVLAGPFYDVVIDSNEILESTTFVFVDNVPGGHTMTSVVGTEANATYDRLVIRQNICRDLSTSANGIDFSLGNFTTALVGSFVVENNDLQSTGGAGFGMVLLGYSTATTNNEIIVRDNRIRGFGYYFYYRDGGRYIIERNNCAGAATADSLDGGGYISIGTTGNRFSSAGILRGTATLVAGTVTVSNTEIRTGDTVMLTRKAIGGTVGQVSLGTITNATSFVINSDNAADTSSVFWQIVH